ncbi:hypothetical protein TEPIDINF_000573 [Tepidibacillus infernus]|nr:hypothetical protein [Tepidibacillus decaturensis]
MSEKEIAQIEDKNQNRIEAIDGFRGEIQDEVHNQQDNV